MDAWDDNDLDDLLSASASGTNHGVGSDLFELEPVKERLSRGRGQVTAVHVRGDALVASTARNWVLKYDLLDPATPPAEAELRRPLDGRLTDLWVSPRAHAALASVRYGSQWETYLLSGDWRKPKALHKTKGRRVTAVAFLPKLDLAADGQAGEPSEGGGAAPGEGGGITSAIGGAIGLGALGGARGARSEAAQADDAAGPGAGAGAGGFAAQTVGLAPCSHLLDALVAYEGGVLERLSVDRSGRERASPAPLFRCAWEHAPADDPDGRIEGVEAFLVDKDWTGATGGAGGSGRRRVTAAAAAAATTAAAPPPPPPLASPSAAASLRMVVLVLTRARLYVLVGPPDPVELFRAYGDPGPAGPSPGPRHAADAAGGAGRGSLAAVPSGRLLIPRALDLPSEPGPCSLDLHRPDAAAPGAVSVPGAGGWLADAVDALPPPDALAVLCPAGLYYCSIDGDLVRNPRWLAAALGDDDAEAASAAAAAAEARRTPRPETSTSRFLGIRKAFSASPSKRPKDEGDADGAAAGPSFAGASRLGPAGASRGSLAGADAGDTESRDGDGAPAEGGEGDGGVALPAESSAGSDDADSDASSGSSRSRPARRRARQTSGGPQAWRQGAGGPAVPPLGPLAARSPSPASASPSPSSASSSRRAAVADELAALKDHHVLPAALLALRPGEGIQAVAQTRLHVAVLMTGRISIVNKLSKRVAQDLHLDGGGGGKGLAGGGAPGGPPSGGPPLGPGALPSHGPSALPAAPSTSAQPPPAGLSTDPSSGRVTVWVRDAAFELCSSDEDRDLWRLWLERGEYALARGAARTARQRNEVALAAAEAALAEGDAVRAAREFGRCTAAEPSFEDVCLRLSGRPEALTEFLETRLDVLGPQDAPQATMLATWLLELLTDRLNAAALRDVEVGDRGEVADGGPDGAAAASASPAPSLPPPSSSSSRRVALKLRQLVTSRTALLDPPTTRQLLAGSGRRDDLVAYLSALGDLDAVLDVLLFDVGDAAAAAAVLRNPQLSREAVYRAAPAMAALSPAAAVDGWLAASPPLDPARLLPALLELAGSFDGRGGSRAPGRGGARRPPDGEGVGEAPGRAQTAPGGEALAASSGPRCALRYVRAVLGKDGGAPLVAVQTSAATSRALHDLAVDLLSRPPADEQALLDFLGTARTARNEPLFDAPRALRLARARGLPRAVVELLCVMELPDDAVDAALAAGEDRLAADVARAQRHDAPLARRLWLRIARRRIEEARVRGWSDEPKGDAAAGEEDGAAAPSSFSEGKAAVAAAAALLHDAEDALKIEDILELFPDFVRIDAFRGAVCEALEERDREVARMREEIAASSETAQVARRALAALESRRAEVDARRARCDACGRALDAPPPASAGPTGGLVPKVAVFPSGGVYHGSCLCAEAAKQAASAHHARRIATLQAAAARGSERAGAELEREACAEDPHWGEGLLRLLGKPLVGAGEVDLACSWV